MTMHRNGRWSTMKIVVPKRLVLVRYQPVMPCHQHSDLTRTQSTAEGRPFQKL
jgi:hypothetical protein